MRVATKNNADMRALTQQNAAGPGKGNRRVGFGAAAALHEYARQRAVVPYAPLVLRPTLRTSCVTRVM